MSTDSNTWPTALNKLAANILSSEPERDWIVTKMDSWRIKKRARTTATYHRGSAKLNDAQYGTLMRFYYENENTRFNFNDTEMVFAAVPSARQHSMKLNSAVSGFRICEVVVQKLH